MKKILFVLATLVLATIAHADYFTNSKPTFCSTRNTPCMLINSDGAYWGQVVNVSSGVWGLGYGLHTNPYTSSTNGTSALTWTNAGVVTIPGTLSVTGGITGSSTLNVLKAGDTMTGPLVGTTITASTHAVTALVNPVQQTCTTGQYQFGTSGLYLCVATGWVKAMAGATQITWTTY